MGETEKLQIADVKPVRLTSEDKKTIEEKPKPKSSAYEWYAKGLEIRDTNPREALTDFKKAIEIDPGYTAALMGAGSTAGDTLNLFDEALGYLERAEKRLKGRNETNTVDYAGLMMNIGLVYNSKGRLDLALEYYLNSQSVWDRLDLKHTTYYAGLMANIGNVYDSKGHLDRAFEYYLNAKSIQDGLGLQNTAGYARLMLSIGVVYLHKGQLDRAFEYYLNSQSLQERLGLQNTVAYAGLMMNIGMVYDIKDQPDRALEYYLNTQSIWDRLGLKNTAHYASLMMNIGVVYKNKGHLDRALEYYLNSQSIQDGLGLQNTVAYAKPMSNIAWVYEKQGKRDLAGGYYRKAYDTYVKAGYSGPERDKALNNAERLGTFSRAGEKARDGRFIAYDNGTVLDTKTKLMWAAKDNGSNINWKNAKSYSESYRGGGYSDWRLPTQDELVGLYDRSRSKPRPAACDTSGDIHVDTKLIDITCFAPWASETRGSEAACFHFLGKRFWSPQSEDSVYRALPVRSAE
jgi:tetratricopeptide (TPR) repeat protein